MTRSTRIFLVLVTVLGCVGCDQTTKAIAKTYLAPAHTLSFAGDTVRLRYAENHGAFLSLGAALSPSWRTFIFTVAVAAGVALLLGYLMFSAAHSPTGVTALALIAGGGLSNLIDRLAHSGAVIDFLNVGVGFVRTGVFNVADVAITAGVAVLLLSGARRRDRSVP